MFTVLCKVSKQTDPAEYKHQKGAGPPFLPLYCPKKKKKKKRISPCHSYSSKRKLLLFVKEALKSSDMKGKSSLREEGHGVRGEIKGAIFPPEPPQTWEKGCRGVGGGDAGGRGQRRPRGPRQPLVPHRHLSAVREGSGCKEVKSLASTPKPSHPLCHPAGNIMVGGESSPCGAPAQAGSGTWGGLGDAEGDGYGEPRSLLGPGEPGCAPSLRLAAATSLWGAKLSDGRGWDHASHHPQPFLPLFCIQPCRLQVFFAE